MVFGNTGENSGSGVAFTRDPASGEKVFYGEFLMNAQGEDVVAGVRTPEPVALLKGEQPKAYAELEQVRETLESHFKDMQDFEFTIEDGKLFMLQTRNGKRTGLAAVRIAVEMVKEKLITWENRGDTRAGRTVGPGAGAGVRPRGGTSGEGYCEGPARRAGARRRGRFISMPTGPSTRRTTRKRFCWCAWRPRRRTCAE